MNCNSFEEWIALYVGGDLDRPASKKRRVASEVLHFLPAFLERTESQPGDRERTGCRVARPRQLQRRAPAGDAGGDSAAGGTSSLVALSVSDGCPVASRLGCGAGCVGWVGIFSTMAALAQAGGTRQG